MSSPLGAEALGRVEMKATSEVKEPLATPLTEINVHSAELLLSAEILHDYL